MIQARRASEEAMATLQSAGVIALSKNKVSTRYPDEICHWVALSLEQYYDDAFCWKVVCHETALNILKCICQNQKHTNH